MFGLGFSEILIIAIVFILFVGPKKLPEVMRTLGGWMRELSQAKEEFARSIRQDEAVQKMKESMEKIRNQVKEDIQETKDNLDTERADAGQSENPNEGVTDDSLAGLVDESKTELYNPQLHHKKKEDD